jgi:predicted nucleic acid-binding protein
VFLNIKQKNNNIFKIKMLRGSFKFFLVLIYIMPQIIIADSCSLILLEKSYILSIFLRYNKIVIPKAVYKETVEDGINAGYKDAKKIKAYIKTKKIIIKDVKKTIDIKVDKGEKQAISLYLKLNADLLLTDDKKVITYSKLKNINYATCPQIIYKMYLLKRISKEKALNAFEIIGNIGWYRQNIINRFYRLILKG